MARSTAWLLLVSLVLVGCEGAQDADPLSATEAVASSSDGPISLAEIEAELPRLDMAQIERDSVVDLYRETAARIAIERSFSITDETAGSLDDLSVLFDNPAGRYLVDRYLERNAEVPEVEDQAVEEFFRERSEDLRRAGARRTSFIFLRERDGEEIRDLLVDLRARYVAGEAFDALAREHSESETRVLGGRLGWMYRGRLPKPVEDVVFALDIREVSPPLDLPGGAGIFYVAEKIDERTYSLGELAPLIRSHLAESRRREALRGLLESLPVPDEAVALTAPQLAAARARREPSEIVLRVGGATMTLSDLLSRVGGDSSPAVIPAFTQLDPFEIYEAALVEALILLEADVEEDVEVVKHQLRRARIVEKIQDVARGEIRQTVEEGAVRAHYENRRHRFQSALRFKLHSLEVRLTERGDETMRQIEALRRELTGGATDLTRVAIELEGTYQSLGWRTAPELSTWDPKVLSYINDVGASGYTVPFQLNRRVQLLWVEEREDPRQLTLEEARDEVLDSLLESEWDERFTSWREGQLERIDFEFVAERLPGFQPAEQNPAP